MNIIFENKEYGLNDYTKCVEKFRNNYPNSRCIAVMLKRSPDLLFLLNYLFENKLTYIPMDPLYPSERLQYMLNDSEPDAIINDSKEFLNYKLEYEKSLYENMDEEVISYILYTSGSTGTPKGVEITQEGLVNFIDGISEIIDFSEGKRIACFTTVAFDIFFLESIMALNKGLTVVLANDEEQRNPKLMAELILKNNVSIIQMTPSRMQLLLNHDNELFSLKNVKEIIIGGEPFPYNLLKTLQEKTSAKIYNMYGPTETTIWSTVSDLTHKDRIDIGQPIKNTEIFIVDERLSILPNGQIGEICIAGKGLAKGYLRREALTAEKFAYLPEKPDTRVYRTGDLGVYLSDGNLECLGRTDNQIKIRGHRIELEDIEAQLNQFDGINQSVINVIETSGTDKILEAIYTSEYSIDPEDITDYLSHKLPCYMIPSIFKRVEEFIHTDNGKIDRKKVLQCVEIKNDSKVVLVGKPDGLTEMQKKVIDIIILNHDNEVLDNIAIDSDFSTAGINSITFIKIVVALEEEFDLEFDDEKLVITEFPKIRSLVEYLEAKCT